MLKKYLLSYKLIAISIMLMGIVPSCALGHEKILEVRDIQFFRIIENKAPNSHDLKISGLAFHSSLAVKGINVTSEDESLIVYVYLVPASAGLSGSFEYTITVPNTVNEVRFGKEKVVIWKRGMKKE